MPGAIVFSGLKHAIQAFVFANRSTITGDGAVCTSSRIKTKGVGEDTVSRVEILVYPVEGPATSTAGGPARR